MPYLEVAVEVPLPRTSQDSQDANKYMNVNHIFGTDMQIERQTNNTLTVGYST
jgi:hypothetical protein